jgi:hypothetical protein
MMTSLGHLDHGDRIVEGRVSNLKSAGRKSVALTLRALGVFQLDRKPVFDEQALGEAHVDRQGLGVWKRVDPDFRDFGSPRRGARGHNGNK